MTSIVIAGRPNSELTSHCILLGENLKQNFPDIYVIVVLKHPDEWDSYSEELSNLFGFGEILHPYVYKSNGELIGDKDRFFCYVDEKYKYKPIFEDYIVERLTQENIKKVQTEYSTRKEGLKLIEKIEMKINEIEFDQENSPLDISFQVIYERGMKLFYKISEKFNPDINYISDSGRKFLFSNLKTKNVLQIEIIEEKKVTETEEAIEEIAHTITSKDNISSSRKDDKKSIIKDIKPEQLINLKKEENINKKKDEKKIEPLNKKEEKKDQPLIKKIDIKKTDSQKDVKPSLSNKDARKSIVPQKTLNSQSILFYKAGKTIIQEIVEDLSDLEENKEEILPKYLNVEYETYNLFQPISYILENYDKYNVEKNIGYNFQILINPFPNLYGEVLVYHKDIKETENQIIDYGQIPSLRKLKYTDENVLKNVKFENPILSSNMKTNIVDFNNFLTDYDLYYLMKSIKEINGVGFTQILPYGDWNYKKFSSSTLKIIKLPLKDLNYEELPLYNKILQKIKSIKREKIKNCQIRNNIDIDKKKPKMDILIENEILNDYFKIKDFFQIEEYDFPHLITCFNKDNFHFSYLKAEIERMLIKLKIMNSDKGLNFIITTNFMFMCPIVSPYGHISGHPLYAEPEFYAGIFNLPFVETEWPETASDKFMKFDLFKILKICSYDESYYKEEESVKLKTSEISSFKDKTLNNIIMTDKSSSTNLKI